MLGVASAQEVTFTPALRVGMVPPPNFVASPTFPGFEHNDKAMSIVLTELPGYVFEGLDREVQDGLQKTPGLVVRREVELKSGARGFMIRGTQTSPQGPVVKWTLVVRQHEITGIAVASVPLAVQEATSEEAIVTALETLTIRPAVPLDEQLAVLPFSLNELAGFRIVRVQPGNAAMLTDGPKDAIEIAEQPLLMITIAPMGTAPPPQERDGIARRMIGETAGLKEIRVTRSEPLRIANQQGHEVLVEAKDVRSGQDITVVQWIRFGSGTMLRIVAMAQKDAWEAAYPRFRQIRDGIGPK